MLLVHGLDHFEDKDQDAAEGGDADQPEECLAEIELAGALRLYILTLCVVVAIPVPFGDVGICFVLFAIVLPSGFGVFQDLICLSDFKELLGCDFACVGVVFFDQFQVAILDFCLSGVVGDLENSVICAEKSAHSLTEHDLQMI